MVKGKTFAAIGVAVALLVAGCSSTSTGGSGSAGSGPGVTPKEINLGYLTDLSGPASAAGKIDYHGSQMFIDQLNKSGGVCGRQIKVQVQDTQYDPQKALSLYQQTEPNVLGFVSILGTPVLSALASRVQQDNVLTTTLGWDRANLAKPNYIVAPSTSDMDLVAGLGWLNEKNMLTNGDAIGEIVMQGLGTAQARGVEYATKKLGLKLSSVNVSPSTTDLTSQVQQFKQAGVKVIVVAGLPTQTASAATAATAIGLNVPILTGPAGFTPELMNSAAGPALADHLYRVLAWSPFSANNPEVTKIRTAFEADPGGVNPADGIVIGWAYAKLYTDIIAKTCDDLTREGMVKALRSTKDLSLTGLTGDLDFSKPGQPPARKFNILKADASVPGAQKLVSDPFISPELVKNYPASAS